MAGYSPQGHKESEPTERLTHTHYGQEGRICWLAPPEPRALLQSEVPPKGNWGKGPKAGEMDATQKQQMTQYSRNKVVVNYECFYECILSFIHLYLWDLIKTKDLFLLRKV